jgi:four helix bundle protein
MFVAYEVSRDLIIDLRTVVTAIERHDRDLADQLRRAASSVTLNLAEGSRSKGGNKQKHFAIAHGSANEVRAALQVAHAWGWLSDAATPFAILDRLLALLWRLTH